jgi:lipopolysaccharide export system protein LptA
MRIPKTGYSLLISVLLIIAFHAVSGSLPQPEKKKRRIDLVWADSTTINQRIANAVRYQGHVEFSQNNVVLFCDSAYSYNDSNMVDAFGNVHIIQGDTLNLYGDRIKYEGNSKIAKVNGNVKLVNKSITLTTDELVFDLRTNIGNYHTWGKIVDTANVLVSKIGRYYSNEDLFFFKDSVKVTNKDFILTADTLKYNSKTERVFIVGPTHIKGTTKQGTLYSEKGWYDTRTNIAELYKASKIMGKEQTLQGDTLFYSRNTGTGRARNRVILSDTTNHVAVTGRTGVYNEKTKIAFVTDSAVFMQYSPKDTLFLHADTLRSIPDLSKKAVVKKAVEQALVAKKSVPAKPDTLKQAAGKMAAGANQIRPGKDSLPQQTDASKIAVLSGDRKLSNVGDSLSTVVDTVRTLAKSAVIDKINQHKDSLSAIADTAKVSAKLAVTHRENPLYRDSARTGSDTLNAKDTNDQKLFLAYHRVRFYKKDLQGICDSLSYQMRDSVMKLFKDPVLWSEVHQLTAERIEYRPHKPGPDIAKLENNGFIISKEDSIKFNQISGKTLIGYIYNNALKTIEVSGNAITLYYLKNKDRYSGMNRLESSKINVYLMKGKIDSISFFPKPEGKTIPLKELTSEDSKLNGFEWRESEKPKNRFDLYPIDEKRKKIAGPEKKPASKK